MWPAGGACALAGIRSCLAGSGSGRWASGPRVRPTCGTARQHSGSQVRVPKKRPKEALRRARTQEARASLPHHRTPETRQAPPTSCTILRPPAPLRSSPLLLLRLRLWQLLHDVRALDPGNGRQGLEGGLGAAPAAALTCIPIHACTCSSSCCAHAWDGGPAAISTQGQPREAAPEAVLLAVPVAAAAGCGVLAGAHHSHGNDLARVGCCQQGAGAMPRLRMWHQCVVRPGGLRRANGYWGSWHQAMTLSR